MTTRSPFWLGLALLLAACDPASSEAPAPAPSSAAPSASAVTSTTAPAPTSSAAPSPPPRCAVAGSPKKLTTLASRRYDVVDWAHDHERLYVLGWRRNAGLGELTAVRKDGTGADTLVELKAPGEPGAVAVAGDHVYFTMNDRLLRVPATGGEASVIAEPFARRLAIFAGHAYGATYSPGKDERVVRVPLDGGAITVLATRPKGRSSLHVVNAFGDIAVDDSGIYVTDPGQSTVWRAPLEGGELTSIAKDQFSPSRIVLTTDRVWFAEQATLRSIDKRAGDVATLLKGTLAFPYMFAEHGDALHFVEGRGEPSDERPRFAVIKSRHERTGAEVEIETLRNDLGAFAVDDACYYVARWDVAGTATIQAMGRP
jgi:hypothetical protein